MSTATRMRTILIAIITVALALGMTVAAPANASAADSPEKVASKASKTSTHIKKTRMHTWVKAGKNLYRWDYNYIREKARAGYLQICTTTKLNQYAVRNITCDNPDFLSYKYKKEQEGETYQVNGDEVWRENYGKIFLTCKKFGKATLKFTEYEFGDAIYDVTANIRYVKYSNPIKKFKVGSKDYAKKFKKQPYCSIKSNSLKGKLSVKPAKGWKLVQIRMVNDDIELRDGSPMKKLKNGAKININNTDAKRAKERSWALEVTCYNKAKNYYSCVILFPGSRPYYAMFD